MNGLLVKRAEVTVVELLAGGCVENVRASASGLQVEALLESRCWRGWWATWNEDRSRGCSAWGGDLDGQALVVLDGRCPVRVRHRALLAKKANVIPMVCDRETGAYPNGEDEADSQSHSKDHGFTEVGCHETQYAVELLPRRKGKPTLWLGEDEYPTEDERDRAEFATMTEATLFAVAGPLPFVVVPVVGSREKV